MTKLLHPRTSSCFSLLMFRNAIACLCTDPTIFLALFEDGTTIPHHGPILLDGRTSLRLSK